MNKIKKYIVLLLVSILCINMTAPVVHAEGITLYISVSSSQVNVGDSITVTVSYSYSGSFAADFQLSWSGPVAFSGGSIGSSGVISTMGNGSASATFTATGAGTASFSVSGAGMDVVTEADLGVSPQGASVTIIDPNANSNTTTEAPSTTETNNNSTTEAPSTTEDDSDDDKSDNAFLYSLSISPGTLEPEFSPYTNTYSAQVDEDVTKLTVSATADDSNAGVSVWGANDLEPGENLVQVAVTAENGNVRYYDIHVMVGEDVGTPFTEIDGVRYSFVDYEEGIEPIEGFESSTLKYEKWQVLAYKAPNDKLYVVPLIPEKTDEESDEEVEYEWYMYVEDKNCFVKYQEYTSRYNRYVIMDVPEGVAVPEGYVETTLTINGNKVTAYEPDGVLVSGDGKELKIYLVYAMNIEGDAGFYNYDLGEDTFMRYNPLHIVKEVIVEATPTEATPEDATLSDAVPASELKDEGFFSKEVITYILFGVSGVLLILLIVSIVLGCKNKNLKDELEDAESMVHQLAGTEPPDKKNKKSKSVVADVDLFAKDDISADASTKAEETEHAPEMTAINEAIDAAIENPGTAKATEDTSAKSKPSEEIVDDIKKDAEVNQEMMLDELPVVDNSDGPQLEIPQIEDVDYEKRTEEINNKIKADYDAFLDSAFSDDTEIKEKNENEEDAK